MPPLSFANWLRPLVGSDLYQSTMEAYVSVDVIPGSIQNQYITFYEIYLLWWEPEPDAHDVIALFEKPKDKDWPPYAEVPRQ